MVEIVSARTELRRAGPSRMEGLCPFHDERTPVVRDQPGGQGRPLLRLRGGRGRAALRAGDGGARLSRCARAALRALPRHARAGVGGSRCRPAGGRGASACTSCSGAPPRYYVRVLWEAGEAASAREYLAGAGSVAREVLREFRVGYSPSAIDRILLGSRREGYSEEELRAVGLIQRSQQDGRPYDRFRGRLMFPLAMSAGTSSVRRAADARGPAPKYLNTADGEIYHKALHLYGATSPARTRPRRRGHPL